MDDSGRPEIPLHPNCMCEWRPRLKTDEEIIAAFKEEMAEELGIIEGTEEQQEMLDAIDRGLCPVCGKAFNSANKNKYYNIIDVGTCPVCGQPNWDDQHDMTKDTSEYIKTIERKKRIDNNIDLLLKDSIYIEGDPYSDMERVGRMKNLIALVPDDEMEEVIKGLIQSKEINTLENTYKGTGNIRLITNILQEADHRKVEIDYIDILRQPWTPAHEMIYEKAIPYFQGKSDEWWDKLSPEDKHWHKFYTYGGDGYINNIKRGIYEYNGVPYTQSEIDNANAAINSLDKWLTEYKLESPMTFQRIDDWGRYKHMAVGEIIPVKNYWSTSLGALQRFIGMNTREGKESVQFEIRVPAGNHGAYIGNHSDTSAEMEYLIKSGQNFKILEIIENGGRNGVPRMVVELMS